MPTESNNTATWPRRFSLGADDFSMQGKPIFREWLKNGIPEIQQEGRRYVPHGSHAYELFTALTGVLVKIETTERAIQGEPRKFLVILLDDGFEKYEVECGDYDGRYAVNLLSRLCNTAYDPRLPIRVAPYRWTPAAGESEKFGIHVTNGADVLAPRYRVEGDETFQPPPAEKYRKKGGKDGLDFIPVANYLLDWLLRNIAPYFPAKVAAVPQERLPNIAAGPTKQNWKDPAQPTVTGADDLPF